MFRVIVLLFFALTNFLIFITCKGTYTINAPGILHANRKYTVCATLHNVTETAILRIGIRGESSWHNVQKVTLQPYETKLLHFYPPKLQRNGNYELYVQAIRGLNFRNSVKLLVGERDGVNIYIETDKGLYKPGDLLRFRVVILNEHAKLMHIIEPIKVQIFDGDNNLVKQFKDIRLHKGIYKNEFQISQEPVLGIWYIKVYIAGKYNLDRQAEFKVEKYVLPKFRTYIETDSDFVIDDGFLNIHVYGRYTYDRYVEGNVTLKLTQLGNCNISSNYSADLSNYVAKFVIDFNSCKNLRWNGPIIVNASIQEKHTNKIESSKTEIHIHKQRYRFDIAVDETEFVSENIQRINVKVLHWNNSAVQETDSKVYLTYGPNRYEANLTHMGIATFEYESSTNSHLPYSLQYKNSSKSIPNFVLYNLKSNTNANVCNLKITTKRPKLNEELEIVVESKDPMQYLVYTLISHANIQKHEIINFESSQNSYTIRLMCTNEMVPNSCLLVHYIDGDDNLVFCEKDIELPSELENELIVTAPNKVNPGEDISITINAQPESYVALVAVDLSSLLLGEGHRIDKETIISNMGSDISYIHKMSPNIPQTISGLIVLTDGNIVKEDVTGFPRNPPKVLFMEQPTFIEPKPFIEPTDVRSFFPETWIFSDYEVTNEVFSIDFKVPDSITTWVLMAFSINPNSGIGFMNHTLNIIASKDFFISTYLPYSIKFGEIVAIPLVVFNYHTENLKTEIMMNNTLNEFAFINRRNNKTIVSSSKTKSITVPSNGGKSVSFLIQPLKLGEITIHIEASNNLANDIVLRKLKVEPDGLAIMHNHELYVQLKSGENFTTYFETTIPPAIEDNSVFLQLSISGNVLLPTFENLDDLVNKPTGCGEQNMIHFVPDVLVLEYLTATGQNSNYKDLVLKAKKYIELGYQQQLKFRYENGGYRVFTNTHITSNWLTAYVTRFFIKAAKFFFISSNIISESLDFLAEGQVKTGEFINTGYLIHPAYQSRYGFTAFVLLTFLENPKYAKKYKNVIDSGLNFLADNLNTVNDLYSLAIMATAFQMAKHPQASIIMDKLKPLSITLDDLEWWEDSTHGRATNIEITSYILLALLHTPGQYLPIAKWLLKQRNNHGGFKSTQDTVVGLQALIKFTQLTAVQNDTLLKISYRALNTQNKELEQNILGLDPNNAKILQQYQLPPATRSLDLEITGTGNIFLQFNYQYRESKYKRSVIKRKSFIFKAEAKMADNQLTMDLKLSITYTPLKDVENLQTNMITAEIDLPSGFIISNENFDILRDHEHIERVENNKPNKIILYFSRMDADDEISIDISADKKDEVRNLQPSTIVVYDFYHTERREMITYEIEEDPV